MGDKKCIYCKGEVPADRIMEVCDGCGRKTWGDKMFKAIIENTNKENVKGNLELGRVGEDDTGTIQEMNKRIENSRRDPRRR